MKHYCPRCASLIGEIDTEVRCGDCLRYFHLECFYWHGCDVAGVPNNKVPAFISIGEDD